MKKILAALLAAILLISAFAACGVPAAPANDGGKQEEAAAPEKEDEAAPAEEASADGKTKIVVFLTVFFETANFAILAIRGEKADSFGVLLRSKIPAGAVRAVHAGKRTGTGAGKGGETRLTEA